MNNRRRRGGGCGNGRAIAVVDQGRCVKCEICIDTCLEQALSMNGLLVIDPERCTGCGACIAGCPSEALSLGRRMPVRCATE